MSETVAEATPKPAPEPAGPSNPTADEIAAKLMARIAPVGQRLPNLKVLIYSDPGAGKSVFLGTCPDNLIVNVEDGLASLANHPDLVKPTAQEFEYKNFHQLETLIDMMHQNHPAFEQYKTLSIDSVSELHKKGLAEVVQREWERNPLGVNRYVAETEHHTENNERIRRLVASLRDLDRNIIITAHARSFEPKNAPMKIFPDFSEKLANTLAGIVDMVIYMYVETVDGQKQRVCRFHSNGVIQAKSRIGGLPELASDVTWDSIYEKFLEHHNKLKK